MKGEANVFYERPPGGPPGERRLPARRPASTSAREALDGARTAIAAAGCETPELDAELIVAHVLGIRREQLFSDEVTVPAELVRPLQQAIRRRAIEREPVAYIVGRRGFRRLELAVDRRVLIPRPETELLVETALELVGRGARVIDVGTGSGAVALALADERPDLRVSASDASAAALEVAKENGRALGLVVGWLEADLLHGVADDYDAAVANLPYVAEPERARLAPEIVRHEPPRALFAGADGLDAIRALAGQLRDLPAVRFVALEVGAGQAGATARLLGEAGFAHAETRRDLAGIERVVVGSRGQ